MGLRRRSGSADTAEPVTKMAGRTARKVAVAGDVDPRPAAAPRGGRARRTRKPLTASTARRLIGVGTAVAPLLAPYALAAAGIVRGRWDAYRAARLGVAPGEVAAFTGRGGALRARLYRVAEALTELDSDAQVHATTAARRFAADTRPRLADLAVAVRAAEQMPSARRRTAYRAIGGELDRIESDLLAHLGIVT